jgi:hypothetical protein
MMLAQGGPFPAQIEPLPGVPGHRGQLARLIRERPYFVNHAVGRRLRSKTAAILTGIGRNSLHYTTVI